MPSDYVSRVLRAKTGPAIESPLERSPLLSKRFHNNIMLKREDLQPVFSFKLRGAYNKIHGLKSKKITGVVAASAGNHAQGVAMAAKEFGLPAIIFMPKTTPAIKVNSVKSFGAEVVLVGDSYDEAYLEAQKAAGETKPFVHPYDDPDVIAGQGTIANELLKQHPNPIHAIFVPVGGGGLIAGISAFVKSIRPEIKIIGVEPEDAAGLYEALKAKKRVVLKEVGIFADGVAVKQVGKEPFRIAQKCVDEVVLVSTDEICAAIKDIFDDTRSIAEPAGALAVAGMKKYIQRKQTASQNLIAIVSGANVNFDRLRHISERAEIGEQKEALFAVTIPEKPGSFKAFCKLLGKRFVTEFNYRYADPKNAHIFVGVELQKGLEEKQQLAESLKKNFRVVDFTDNEMAKIHIRYMVGGKAPKLSDERLFRFQFPERPGALMRFLDQIGELWNISLFHYRNHGAAYGRVLAGIQVPPKDKLAFAKFLKALNYPYIEETENPAYALFL
jgi:threonine dehydratase